MSADGPGKNQARLLQRTERQEDLRHNLGIGNFEPFLPPWFPPIAM